MTTAATAAADSEPRAPGVVELREDVPLKGSGGGAGPGGGWGAPRGVLACFGALTSGITIALLAQLYSGAGAGTAAHGSVAAGGGARCSRAGTDALHAGGGAVDAAAVVALCLAVATPHRTTLDASGVLMVWDYRLSRDKPPVLVSWGAAPDAANWTDTAAAPGAPVPAAARSPRLVCALAALHAGTGAGSGVPAARLSWRQWLQPAVDFGSSPDTGTEPDVSVLPTPRPPPQLTAYLRLLQNYSSADVASGCAGGGGVHTGAAAGGRAGRWQVWGAAGGAGALLRALRAQDSAPDAALAQLDPLDLAIYKAAQSLSAEDADTGTSGGEGGGASGVAIIDASDTYLALVTGISGVGPAGEEGEASTDQAAAQGWVRDEPTTPLDLAPAMLVEDLVCGSRYVMGAESRAALAQAGAALAAGAALTAGAGALPLPGVERARLAAAAGGLAPEALPRVALPPALAALAAGRPPAAPRAAVNVVQQRGDELASHADSRSGGIASRF